MQEHEARRSGEQGVAWREIPLARLGEGFLLFDPNRKSTQSRYDDDGLFAGLRSNIRLESGYLGKLNISIVASPYAKARYAVLTPFDRDQGYPLDRDDLSAQSRAAKISKMQRDRPESIQGLYLFVFVATEDMRANGMLQALLQEEAPPPERDISSLLRHLFLTLKFPNGSSFSARASFNRQLRLILFQTFFPSDTGPLPAPGATGREIVPYGPEGGGKTEGYDLLLPFDLPLLQTIQASFLYLPNLD
jgi:hypothetical protein